MDGVILIVEDNDANRQLLGWTLEDAEYDYIEAASGEEAIELAKTHNNIVLALMDITLPGINGIETTQKIRALDPYQNLPAIALTGHTDSDKKEEILTGGLNEVLAKPIDEDMLLASINKYLTP